MTSKPIVFIAPTLGHDSMSIVPRNLIRGLRMLDREAYSIAAFPGARSYPFFYEGIHLISPPPEHGNYIAIDSCYDSALHPVFVQAEKKIVITAPDDFRWMDKKRRNTWQSAKVLTFSRFGAHIINTLEPSLDVDYFPLGIGPEWHYDKHLLRFPNVGLVWKNFGYRYIPADCKIYLAVSYPQERKGLDALIKAFNKAFMGIPNVCLWIHGRTHLWGNSEPYLELAKSTFSAPRSPMFLWTDYDYGYIYMRRMYSTASWLVMPHSFEGFGLPGLEANACGTPAIYNKCCGPLEFVQGIEVEVKEETKEMHGYQIPWYVPLNMEDILVSSWSRPKPILRPIRHTLEYSARAFLEVINEPRGKKRKLEDGVTVAVPCYHNPADLKRFLESFGQYRNKYPLLVTNDGDDKGIKDIYPDAIPLPDGSGLNKARNILAKHCKTKYILYLDSDIILPSSKQDIIAAWLQAHERYSPCISTILQLLPDGTIDSAGHPFEHSKLPPGGGLEMDREVAYVQGSAMLIPLEILMEVPFDETLALYWEESDWILRVRYLNPNVAIMYLGGMYVIHNIGSTARVLGRQREEMVKEGYERFKERWQSHRTPYFPEDPDYEAAREALNLVPHE